MIFISPFLLEQRSVLLTTGMAVRVALKMARIAVVNTGAAVLFLSILSKRLTKIVLLMTVALSSTTHFLMIRSWVL